MRLGEVVVGCTRDSVRPSRTSSCSIGHFCEARDTTLQMVWVARGHLDAALAVMNSSWHRSCLELLRKLIWYLSSGFACICNVEMTCVFYDYKAFLENWNMACGVVREETGDSRGCDVHIIGLVKPLLFDIVDSRPL